MSLVRYWADNFTQTRFCQLSGKLPHRTHAIFHYFPTVLWSRSIYIFPKEDLANAAQSFREWNILIHDSIVTNGRDRGRRKKLKCQYVSEWAIKSSSFLFLDCIGHQSSSCSFDPPSHNMFRTTPILGMPRNHK